MSRNRVIVAKIVSKQLTVAEAAAAYKISRAHLYRLLARYRDGGLDAVDPRPRTPRTNPRATPEPVPPLTEPRSPSPVKDYLDPSPFDANAPRPTSGSLDRDFSGLTDTAEQDVIPRRTVEALCKSLGKHSQPFGSARFTLAPPERLAPPEMKPLVKLRDLKAWNAYLVGIRVRPVYRDPASLAAMVQYQL